MKCYYDPQQDAVALCKSCGRGVSHDYLTEISKGVACKDRCEKDAEAIAQMIARSTTSSAATSQILRRSSSAAYGSGIFLTVMGVIFTSLGLEEGHLRFSLYLGVGFLAYGLWTLLRAWRYSKLVSTIPKEEGE